MVVIPDVTKRAGEETRARFEELVAGAGVTEEERLANKEKTNRHLRLAELLQSHSDQAEIIFMTLPMPRRGEQNVITVGCNKWLKTYSLTSGLTSGKITPAQYSNSTLQGTCRRVCTWPGWML